jgi:hypothetical protein
VIEQVPRPYKTTGKIIVLYIEFYNFGKGKGRLEFLDQRVAGIAGVQSDRNLFMNTILISYTFQNT